MIQFLAGAAVLVMSVTPTPRSSPTPTTPADFGGNITGTATVEDQVIELDAERTVPGEPGVESAGQGTEAAPETYWIWWSELAYVTDPPCITTGWEELAVDSRQTADAIAQTRENAFVAQYEAIISSGSPPPQPCPDTPGIDPTPLRRFAAEADAVLPFAQPSISGGHAITGMRSWLDLGRTSDFTTTRQLDLGGITRTATFHATATTTIDWGDGTTTTHTTPGGPWHEGEPGPDDITHTYRDTTDITLVVTDTWDITVSVPGVRDITLTYTAEPAQLQFPVREVRSRRDR